MAIDLTSVARMVSRLAARTAPQSDVALTASEAVAARRAVRIVNGQVRVVQAGEVPDGVSVLGAAQGAVCAVILDGVALDVLPSPADIGKFYWLGANGTVTPTEPTTPGSRRILLGYSVGFDATTTAVLVDIVDLGVIP